MGKQNLHSLHQRNVFLITGHSSLSSHTTLAKEKKTIPPKKTFTTESSE